MIKYTKSLGWVLLCITGLASNAYSQSNYHAESTNEIAMRIKGTSTLHDWEMDTKQVTGNAHFVFKTGSDELVGLKSLTFAIEVKDLKSDNSRLDENAYEALKADKFKDIRYMQSQYTLVPQTGGYLIKSEGKLTIAGVTNDIVMYVHLVVNENNSITCKGNYKLNMSDYEVKPPSFMLGAMKTGDAISLDFTVIYKKSL